MERLRTRRRAGDDSGFGLIETVIALLIAGIVFGALATTLISAVQASVLGRQNQQAADFMTRELELLRAQGFGALAHVSSDIAGDTMLSSCAGGLCLDVNGTPETVVTGPGAGLATHTTTLNSGETNNTEFTVSRYITEMADQPRDEAVRATVFISWQTKNRVHTRSTSTVIAYTQRGLPLPVFKLELPVATLSVNPGGTLTYDLTLTNQGAPDTWNLALGGASSGWSWFADTDGDGALSVGDAPLGDSSGDGIVDTDRIDPATTFRFFLTRDTPTTEALGTKVTTITATSYGQPSAAGAQKSVTATSILTSGVVVPPPGPTPTPTPGPVIPPEPVCTPAAAPSFDGMASGYSSRQFMLHSDGLGSTPLQQQMTFNSTWVDEPTLPVYSTDVDAAATGRVLVPAGATLPTGPAALTLTDARTFADWSTTVSKKTWLDGTAVVRVWVSRRTPAAGAASMKVVLYKAASNSATKSLLTEVTVPVTIGCAGFQEVYFKLPDIPQPDLAKNAVYGIRLVSAGAAGTDDLRLAYDVASQFPASIIIGSKP